MAYEQEKKFLEETAAIRVSYGANPQTGDVELVRRWNTSRHDLQSSSLTYLNTLKTVTDPKADGKEYPGVFRVMGNTASYKKGMQEQEQGITQTLRYLGAVTFGWASAYATLDCIQSAAYRNRTTPLDAIESVQGVITEAQNTLNEHQLYDATATRNHSHPYQFTTHTAENALGTVDDIGYRNFLTRPQAPASTIQGTIYDAQSSINRDGSYDGKVDYSTSKEKIMYSMTADTVVDQTYEYAYTNYRTRPAIPASTVQGIVYDAKSTINKDDTYDGTVGYVYSKPKEWYDLSVSVTGESYNQTYLNSRARPVSPAMSVVGVIYDAKSSINRDETYNGNVGYEYGKPAQWHDVVDAVMGTDVKFSYLNQQAQRSAPSTLAQGFLYDGSSTLNKDGSYNGSVGYAYSKESSWVDVTVTVMDQSYAVSYLNYRVRPSAPADVVQGFIYDVKTTNNKDGTYNGNTGYVYSKPDSWQDITETMLATKVDNSYLNYRARPTAPAAAVQGFVYDAKTTDNKDGTYNGNVGYVYSKPDAWMDATETVLGQSVAYSYLNQRTRPTAPAAAVQGFVYDVKTTDNQDGTYNGNVGYEYSKEDAWLDTTENAIAKNIGVSYLNYRTRPTAPAGSVQGAMYEVKTTDNKDGTYNGNLDYKLSKAVVIGQTTTQTSLMFGYAVDYLSSKTFPTLPATTVGVIYEAKSSINADETYNATIGYSAGVYRKIEWNWLSNDGRHFRTKYENVNGLPGDVSALTAAFDTDVDVVYQPNSLYQVKISKEPLTWTWNSAGDTDDIGPVYMYRRQYRSDFTEFRTMTIEKNIKLTPNRERAEEFLEGGMDQSKVERNGNGWMATRFNATFDNWADLFDPEAAI